MEAFGGRRYSSYLFLTSALDGGEWSASRLPRFTPRERTSGTHWIGGWAGPAVWTQGLEEKSSAPVGNRTPIVQSIVKHYTD
jgi:hypothetical protein